MALSSAQPQARSQVEIRLPSEVEKSKSPLLTEKEIMSDKKLLRYHHTVVQTLNDIHEQSMAVTNGIEMKGHSVAAQILTGANVVAAVLPVFSQFAQLAISAARFGVDRHDERKDSEVAEKILALNPTHDTHQWNDFTRQLATQLTSENQEEIRNWKKIGKNNDEIGNKTRSILSSKPKLPEEASVIKDMATRDCARILTKILSKPSPSKEDYASGIEADEVELELIEELVTSARTPPPIPQAKEIKSIFSFNHGLVH